MNIHSFGRCQTGLARCAAALAATLASTFAVALASTCMAQAAEPTMTQQLEPTTIDEGQAARLTIAESGARAMAITPPMVSGLEFLAVGQSQQMESINGVTRSTTSVTYRVIPRQAGVFTIPGLAPGAEPVVLTVHPGSGGSGGGASGGVAAGVGGSATGAGLVPGSTRVSADGSAFVRLRLSKHDLYVGERIPVDIQVGTRDGLVASLNGPPTLNGDAFTLEKLSSQPQRAEELIAGKSFTVFTWHSALAAVKPGTLSLTMETPLTVRIRTAMRPESGPFGDSLDDFFNDPALQSFFGQSTEKDVTVASPAQTFTVLALPAADRPADFSGAVGHFTVSSDLSDGKATAGDPLTLHLHVSGAGNFDRVDTRMLHDVDHWKTYAPTATFEPADEIGYRGEKTFDQPVIAMQSGAQSLPPLTFSWFDPATRRYVEAHTSPLRVAVVPVPAAAGTGSVAGGTPLPGSSPNAVAANAVAANAVAANAVAANASVAHNAPDDGSPGLRRDHVLTGGSVTSLRPHYFQPAYVAPPSLLAFAFLGAGFWVRRRERSEGEARAARESAAGLRTEPLLRQMDEAAMSTDVERFIRSARMAVQRALASRWQVEPARVTLEEVGTRLGEHSDVARLFELADEARYSTVRLTTLDFKHWKQIVLAQISAAETAS